MHSDSDSDSNDPQSDDQPVQWIIPDYTWDITPLPGECPLVYPRLSELASSGPGVLHSLPTFPVPPPEPILAPPIHLFQLLRSNAERSPKVVSVTSLPDKLPETVTLPSEESEGAVTRQSHGSNSGGHFLPLCTVNAPPVSQGSSFNRIMEMSPPYPTDGPPLNARPLQPLASSSDDLPITRGTPVIPVRPRPDVARDLPSSMNSISDSQGAVDCPSAVSRRLSAGAGARYSPGNNTDVLPRDSAPNAPVSDFQQTQFTSLATIALPVPPSRPDASQLPPSPDGMHVARNTPTWKAFLGPLCSRLHEALYGKDGQDCSALLEAVSGHVNCFTLDGFGTRDSVDNMTRLLQFLRDHPSKKQAVEGFVVAMQGEPTWPERLKGNPLGQHVDYAWMLLNGLLAVVDLKSYLEPVLPSTFSGIVRHIFPPVPDGTTPPPWFSFTARELVNAGFTIQPTSNLLDHLKLVGNAVSVYTISSDMIELLMGYENNRAARAIGLAGLGNECMHSYVTLLEGEERECYRLPISLGILKIDDGRHLRDDELDDLTVITRVIRMYRGDYSSDRTPHLLASRVLTIEAALRQRRHWSSRLRHDIYNRTPKVESWMFWGTVLAISFGICAIVRRL
ncbi:hypothetical protein FKP32DRAFT_1036687 [Trametes sanguinea]|nr:hypothetical protein FKP32DRAFT_1036687 [Trametes sanguinea]